MLQSHRGGGDEGAAIAMWAERQQGLTAGAERLAHMVMQGQLTEADAFEVRHTIELLVEYVRDGRITQHFADVVLRKLALEKEESCAQRREETTWK